MPWKTNPKTLFLKAGEAKQIAVSFGDNWIGPQFMQALHDEFSSGGSGAQILVMQWHGVANEVVFGGPSKKYYVCGVHNAGNTDVSFHLEGGNVA